MQRINLPWGESIALLGGILMVLSFSPFDYSLLAIVALLLLLLSWRQVGAGRVAWRGYLFGLGMFGTGVSWVFIGIYDHSEATIIVAGLLTALFVAYLALFPAMAGWITATFFSVQNRLQLALAFPAIWTLLEWFRSWFLTGFPWLQVGYSQISSPLSGLAPITGVYGLSWACALTASSLYAAWNLCGLRRWRLIGILVFAWFGAGLLTLIEWTRPLGLPFQATLIQANIPQAIKWLPKQRDNILRLYTEMTRQHWDSRLIVWPETAMPGIYNSQNPNFITLFEKEAIKHNSALLFGAVTSGAKPNEYYNAMKSLGKSTGTYFKRHRVPFGEYLPFKPASRFIADLMRIPMATFSAGNDSQKPIVAAGYPLAASICYEDVFGRQSLLGLPDAAYLVNITNDGWWGNSLAPYQHIQMARFRALETGRFMLRAANTGITAFINPSGNMISNAPLLKRKALTGRVTPMTGSTPYILFGDYPILYALFISLVAAKVFARRLQS